MLVNDNHIELDKTEVVFGGCAAGCGRQTLQQSPLWPRFRQHLFPARRSWCFLTPSHFTNGHDSIAPALFSRLAMRCDDNYTSGQLQPRIAALAVRSRGAIRGTSPGSGLHQSRSQTAIVHQALLVLRLQHAHAVGSLDVMAVARRLSFQAVMHRLQLGLLSSNPRFQGQDPGLSVFPCRVDLRYFLCGEFNGLFEGVTF